MFDLSKNQTHVEGISDSWSPGDCDHTKDTRYWDINILNDQGFETLIRSLDCGSPEKVMYAILEGAEDDVQAVWLYDKDGRHFWEFNGRSDPGLTFCFWDYIDAQWHSPMYTWLYTRHEKVVPVLSGALLENLIIKDAMQKVFDNAVKDW